MNIPKHILQYSITIILCVTTIILFSLPFIFSIFAQFEYLGESVAYRYFSSARIFMGDSENVWLPQGYLVSLIQHFILLASPIDLANFTHESLRKNLNIFGFFTNGIIVLINCSIIIFGFFSKNLQRIDHLILILVCLVPIYCFGDAGFYYSTLPDYYHLNMVLVTATVLFFLLGIRRVHPASFNELMLLGIFIGLSASNKITMLVVSSAAALPFIQDTAHWGLRRWFSSLLIIALAALTTFFIIFFSFYLFEWGRILPTLNKILNFSTGNWAQPNFATFFEAQLIKSGYIYVIFSFFFISIMHLFLFFLNRKLIESTSSAMIFSTLRYKIIFGLFLIGCLQFFFVYKRPADTTLFESAVSLFAVSALLVFMIDKSPLRKILLFGLVIISLYSFCNTHGLGNLSYSNSSGKIFSHTLLGEYQRLEDRASNAKFGWLSFEKIQNFHRRITVIIPDNEYWWRENSPFEVLLKGTSNFPSWEISTGNQFLESLQSPLSFRSEHISIKPNEPYADNEILVWFDRRDMQPLTQRYPSLESATKKLNCSYEDFSELTRFWICVPRM